MEQLTFSEVERGLFRLSFKSLPLWTGLKQKPADYISFPFQIESKIGYPIYQSNEEIILEKILKSYESDDYSYITPPPGSNEWSNALGLRNFNFIEEVMGDKKVKSILEIGAGSTWLAEKIFEKFSPKSYCIVDPSLDIKDKKIIEIVKDFYPTSKLNHKKFDVILGFNVLEHVKDPVGFLKNIYSNLSDEGIVILTLPNCTNQFEKGDLNVLIHEHMTYFTEKSMLWSISEAGFEIYSVSTKNDLFKLSLKKRKTVDTESISLLNEIKALENAYLQYLSFFNYFRNLILQFAEQDKKIAFHGATHGLNSFLHLTGLGDCPSIRLYDGDKSKVGMFLPACQHAVLSPESESYENNDLIVVSAMSFFSEIKKFALKHKNFNERQIIEFCGVN
ncbi:class I SAM-dependent methyltransferase [Leptospira alexanderi]|uniref:class I SAM-dependent methyltransferase n=1 Tax=Leptospira alexanderi TaxID=100053 RepID=UPI000990B00E|nr:class I SAM-dependent methyltransferase [Leptospira alexanderi]